MSGKSQTPGPRAPAPGGGRLARGAQWAIIFLGVYLLLLFLSAIASIRVLVRAQEELLPDYISVASSSLVGPRDYYFFLEFLTDASTGRLNEDALADYEGSLYWVEVANSLQSLRRQPFLRGVHVLTTGGSVIMRGDGTTVPPEEREKFAAEDDTAIAAAAAGNQQEVRPRSRAEARRTYLPLLNRENRVVALLRLEAESGRSSPLALLRNRLFVGFLISGAVLVFLYFGTVRLVRRTLEAERAAGHADRLRALGTMTAGISHEIRNPLGIITLQLEELEVLLRELPVGSSRVSLESIATELRAETKRLKGLTEDFLRFASASAQAGYQPAPVDIAEVVEATVRLWAKGLSPERRRVDTRIPHRPAEGAETPRESWLVLFSEDRLRQIVLNLLRNADEALGEKPGSIAVAVARSGAMLEVVVEDDGPGMDSPTIRQIFDPFFTTRAEGTGLGLSLSRALAESAGGSLAAESEPGKGARFRLLLPSLK